MFGNYSKSEYKRAERQINRNRKQGDENERWK